MYFFLAIFVFPPKLVYHIFTNFAPGTTRGGKTSQLLSEAFLNNETIHAFEEKGYSTAFISHPLYVFPPITDYYYNTLNFGAPLAEDLTSSQSSAFRESEYLSSYYEIMEKLTPLSVLQSILGQERVLDILYNPTGNFAYTDVAVSIDSDAILIYHPEDADARSQIDAFKMYTEMIRSLQDAIARDGPKFCLINNMIPHWSFLMQADGTLNQANPEEPAAYYENHIYTGKVLINMIDMILESDPNAIIILQADHGIHAYEPEELMAKLDISPDEVLDVYNSVMSAVRIPEEYGHLDEPLTPLNISRYLINNYVGKNYDYLGDDEYIR